MSKLSIMAIIWSFLMLLVLVHSDAAEIEPLIIPDGMQLHQISPTGEKILLKKVDTVSNEAAYFISDFDFSEFKEVYRDTSKYTYPVWVTDQKILICKHKPPSYKYYIINLTASGVLKKYRISKHEKVYNRDVMGRILTNDGRLVKIDRLLK